MDLTSTTLDNTTNNIDSDDNVEADDIVPHILPVLSPNLELLAAESSASNAADIHHYNPSSPVSSNRRYVVWLRRVCSPVPIRYLLTALACAGFMNSYALRVNLSVAIVAMVAARKKNVNSGSHCAAPAAISNTSEHQNFYTAAENESFDDNDSDTDKFDWSEQVQSQVLAAFFYGYILTQFLGGYLAPRCGAHRVFGWGLMCTAFLTLFTPLCARSSPWALFALRFFEGFGEGVTYPAMHAFWSRWAPKSERATLVGITYAGSQLGTIIAMISSGLLSSWFGWPSVFYVFGTVGVIWCALWLLLSADSPSTHALITSQERDYIVSQTTTGDRVARNSLPPVPWRRFLFSLPVLAVCIAHFGVNWCLYTFVIELPTYMSSVLNFSLRSNGALSALPYAAQWLAMIGAGLVADRLLRQGASKSLLNVTKIRKLFTLAGLFLPALFIMLVSFAGCNQALAVACLIASLGTLGLTQAGFMINHIDIASEYAGSLMALSNTAGTVPGFLVPFTVAQLIGERMYSVDAWRWFFYISTLIFVACGSLYAVFASGKRLAWLDAYVSGGSGPKSGVGNDFYRDDGVQEEEQHGLMTAKSGSSAGGSSLSNNKEAGWEASDIRIEKNHVVV